MRASKGDVCVDVHVVTEEVEGDNVELQMRKMSSELE